MDLPRAAAGVAAHHDVVDDLHTAIADHYLRHVQLGLIGVPQPGGDQHGDR